jgi:hypothetical protein
VDLEKYKRELRDEARRRGVQSLLHFTPFQNASSILEHGLLSRQDLEDDFADGCGTDDRRLDGYPECICLSIEDINHSMFRAKRRDYRHWVVLAVDASVIWENDCRFCWRSAASGEIIRTTSFIGGPWAFRRMFEAYETARSRPNTEREKYQIPDNLPTDPGAEVQVYGRINREKITAFGVASSHLRTRLEAEIQKVGLDLPVEVVDWIA